MGARAWKHTASKQRTPHARARRHAPRTPGCDCSTPAPKRQLSAGAHADDGSCTGQAIRARFPAWLDVPPGTAKMHKFFQVFWPGQAKAKEIFLTLDGHNETTRQSFTMKTNILRRSQPCLSLYVDKKIASLEGCQKPVGSLLEACWKAKEIFGRA